MSKMRMPEMSVVRFNESDVIVASNLGIYNFHNGQHSDGYMMYGGNRYTYGNSDKLIALLPNDQIDTTDDGTQSIHSMFWSELDPTSQYNVETTDGIYVRDSITGHWVHQ